jgi:hypothetical protein
MKAKDFLDNAVREHQAMWENYDWHMEIVDNFIVTIDEIIKAHDETNIDHMKDIWIDLRMHIYLMRMDLATMKVHRDITVLKYKRMCIKDWEDKRDSKDKMDLVRLMYFSDVDWRESLMYSIGNLHTMLQNEIKSLAWDKRASEFVSA